MQAASLADRLDALDPAAAALRLGAALDLAHQHGVADGSLGGALSEAGFDGSYTRMLWTGLKKEGGVPSRLLKTDAGADRQEGTPWRMYAGS
ncbi:MAG: hypothetical protein ACR2LA_05545, partial [Acidimicrobiales bacterium]